MLFPTELYICLPIVHTVALSLSKYIDAKKNRKNHSFPCKKSHLMTVKLYNDSIRQITCYKDQAHVNNYKYFLNTYNLPLQLNLLPISRKAVYLTLTKIQNTLLSTRARRVVAPSCLVHLYSCT